MWNNLATDQVLNKTAAAIRGKGIEVIIVDTKKQALEKILELIPAGAEIANGSSTTLQEIGYIDYLKSGEHKWKNLHEEILKEPDGRKQTDLRRKSVSAEYFLGSVNAIAETGELVACDATGSRVSAYPFAAGRLVLVAGAQKIVPTLNDAVARIREYVFPLENARAQKAYGSPSSLGKWVILENEKIPQRTTLILVKEKLGF